METAISSPSSPIKYSVEYPESLSRGTLILKTLFGIFYVGIPHGIILGLYGAAVGIVHFIVFWAILFTGKFPKGMFDFIIPYLRWWLRVKSYMIMFNDKYPPFNGDENVDYPTKITVDYPENLSRGTLILKVLFGWAYVGIPHGIILMFYGIAVVITQIITWWSILLYAKFPKSFFDFTVSYFRWYLRVTAYMSFFTDIYPPFNGEE
jgi:hypothetical protein